MGCKQSTPTAAEHKISRVDARLTVIIVHYNPQHYKRRAQLVNECLQRLTRTKARLSSPRTLEIVAVELTYGHHKPEILPVDDVRIIRRNVPERQVMWSKEQLINLAIRSLPQDDEYIAWIDSDIGFTDDSWVSKAILALSRHPLAFGQLWTTCDMLGPDGRRQEGMTMTSFAQQRAAGKTYVSTSNRQVDEYWHPGFAWIATRRALEATGGLIDRTLGSADRHMAMSFLGRAAETVPENVHTSYKKQVLEWQQKVNEHGIEFIVVPVHIQHFWHGPMRRRLYMERWDVLAKHKYDPYRYLQWNPGDSLYYWSEECPDELMEDVMDYFEHRQEDSHDHLEDYLVEEISRGVENVGPTNERDDDGEQQAGADTAETTGGDADAGIGPAAAAAAAVATGAFDFYA